jgi:Ca2+/Na+ antiporter
MVPFTLEVVNDPGSPARKQYPPLSMSPKRSGPSKEPPPSPGKGSSLFDTKLRPRTAVGGGGGGGGVGGVSGAAGSVGNGTTAGGSSSTSTSQQNTVLLSPSLPRSSSLPLTSNGGAASGGSFAGVAANLKEAAAAWWRDVPYILEETLHLHGKTGIRRYFTYITSPLVLFMHATMPTLHSGHTFSMAYASVLAVIAPPFFLYTASMSPSDLGGSAFVTVWFSSTLVLITLAFVVQPIGSPAQFSSGFILPSSPTMAAVSGGNLPDGSGRSTSPPLHGTNGNIALSGTLSPSFAAALQPAASSKPSIFTGQRPRRCIFFALLAFIQCILWLNATAEEVVSIFEAIGRIWNVRRDTLGATVLAWGETVPDLVAVVSLSKAGQGTMAIAACFGGPVFNLLVSMGGPILIAGTRTGSIPYQMTSGVIVLVVSTVAVLAGLLIAVPLRYQWRLQRELGWVLLGVYAFSQIIFLLAEGIVL